VPDEPEQPGSGAHHASTGAVRHGVHAVQTEAQVLARRSEAAAGHAVMTAAHAMQEPRWPAAIAVVIAIGFSTLLPDRLTLGPP
jgi:hypothetical protein